MKRAGVIGWPVAHSLSPVLHGYWLKEHGIEGSYERIPAAPEDFTATIARLRSEGFSGVNCTVPHKEAAFALADGNDDVAKAAGATNLLVFGADGISGFNTDAYGLMASLKEKIGTLGGKTVVLLGAGGAARGALLALQYLGANQIYLLVRNMDRAEDMLTEVASPPGYSGATEARPLEMFSQIAVRSELVVNATSAGMGTNPPLDLDLSALPQGATVCDIVYHPLETQLLKDAQARGLRTIDGLGMLMHQAVPSFEAFFGVRPEVTAGLRTALVDALGKR